MVMEILLEVMEKSQNSIGLNVYETCTVKHYNSTISTRSSILWKCSKITMQKFKEILCSNFHMDKHESSIMLSEKVTEEQRP